MSRFPNDDSPVDRSLSRGPLRHFNLTGDDRTFHWVPTCSKSCDKGGNQSCVYYTQRSRLSVDDQSDCCYAFLSYYSKATGGRPVFMHSAINWI
jgi:hypothetical protein